MRISLIKHKSSAFIDLFLALVPDSIDLLAIAVEVFMSVVPEAKKQGPTREAGVSNFTTPQDETIGRIAAKHGATPARV